MKSIVFIVAATSDAGIAIADSLHATGKYKVYGTSRRPEKYKNFSYPIIYLDVNNEDSINKAVSNILNEEGRIDILINVSNMFSIGASEEFDHAQIEQQMNTNFMGVVRVNSAVLPHMRSRKKGNIIYIGNIAGMFGLPFMSYFSASKFATHGYLHAIYEELKPLGIYVSKIVPMHFLQNSLTKSQMIGNKNIVDYSLHKAETIKNIMSMNDNGEPSVEVAKMVLKILHSKKQPKFYNIVGSSSISGQVLLWIYEKIRYRVNNAIGLFSRYK